MNNLNPDTEEFFKRWVKITLKLLEQSLGKHRIHQTGALESGLDTQVQQLGDKLLAEFYFKLYGRFVDMGKGAIAESTESNRHLILAPKGRKPKPWYSKTFFARLSNLRGGLGFQMSETVIKTIRESIEN